MDTSEYNILLFRHGETDWNRENRLQGQTDIPLNSYGKKQAEVLAKILKSKKLEILYSSDLQRAKETSQIIAEHLKIDIIYQPGLREIFLGQAQGCLDGDLSDRFGESSYRKWKDSSSESDHFHFPDGESKLEAETRAGKTIIDLLKTYPFRRIGICTHGFIINRLDQLFEKRPISEKRIQNCEIRRFQVSPGNWNQNDRSLENLKFTSEFSLNKMKQMPIR